MDLICRRNSSSVCKFCWHKFAGPILAKTCDGEFHILYYYNVIYRILGFKLGGVSASPTMAQICHCVIERREEGRSLVISAGRRKKVQSKKC